VILLVDGLYWGTRRLVESLMSDHKRMLRAAEFLMEGQFDGDEVQ
jgi:hypothetical protein